MNKGPAANAGELSQPAKLTHPEHVRMARTQFRLFNEPRSALGMELFGNPSATIRKDVVFLDPELIVDGQIAETVQLLAMAPQAWRTTALASNR